jgi:hypothetical protein
VHGHMQSFQHTGMAIWWQVGMQVWWRELTELWLGDGCRVHGGASGHVLRINRWCPLYLWPVSVQWSKPDGGTNGSTQLCCFDVSRRCNPRMFSC